MERENERTLAKLAALQARCDRLERALIMLVVWNKQSVNALDDEIDKIIKGD